MRFIWGHTLVHVLSPVNASSDSLHIHLALFSAALLGVGWRGGFSSYIFPNVSITVGFLPWGCFILQGIIHLGYLLTLNSQPCPIWTFTWGLCSILKSPLISQCLQRFRRGFRIFRRIFPIVPAQFCLSVPSNIPRGLRSRWRVFDSLTACLAALLWRFSYPPVPSFLGGYPKFWEGLLHNFKQLPGKSASWLLFFLCHDG